MTNISFFIKVGAANVLLKRLFLKPGMQERGTECGECGERGECLLGFRGISKRIPGNVIILTFPGMFKKIPRNVRRDSGECSRRFRGMFEEIPGNVEEDSGECSRRFRGILKKISANVNLKFFCEILLIFYQILQLKCEKTKEYFLRY